MAERVVFADDWQPVLAEAGLQSFDDFFEFRKPKVVPDSKRRVITITIGDDKRLFLKCFRYSHLKDAIFALRNFGRLLSQAEVEWENAYLLLEIGVQAYKPVCCGVRTRWGLEKESFLVTEEVSGQCLTDFVGRNWATLSQQQREDVIVSLAKLIRRIHDAGIGLADLYLWHLFIREKKVDNGKIGYDFAVIDLHRMQHNIRNRARQIENLGRLNYSMLDEYFDERMRKLLIESYAGPDWPGNRSRLWATVQKHSAALLSRRNQKPY
jgi:hypothetical protein